VLIFASHISQFGSNSFTLASSSLEPIGTVVSPLLAFLNHSCEPNAVVVFPNGGSANEGKSIELVALRDINEGEEVGQSKETKT